MGPSLPNSSSTPFFSLVLSTPSDLSGILLPALWSHSVLDPAILFCFVWMPMLLGSNSILHLSDYPFYGKSPHLSNDGNHFLYRSFHEIIPVLDCMNIIYFFPHLQSHWVDLNLVLLSTGTLSSHPRWMCGDCRGVNDTQNSIPRLVTLWSLLPLFPGLWEYWHLTCSPWNLKAS